MFTTSHVPRRSARSYLKQRGLTLIELVMFMVIMGMAAASIMRVMNMSTQNSTDPLRRKQALMIAEAYMEEVQLARFTVCDPADNNASNATIAAVNAAGTDSTRCFITVESFGPETGNARPYDNINDYVPVNYVPGTPVRAFANAANKDVDVAGNARSGNLDAITTTLTLSVNGTLGPAGMTVASDAAALNMNFLRITITTTYGTGPNDVITLDSYRTRYAPSNVP